MALTLTLEAMDYLTGSQYTSTQPGRDQVVKTLRKVVEAYGVPQDTKSRLICETDILSNSTKHDEEINIRIWLLLESLCQHQIDAGVRLSLVHLSQLLGTDVDKPLTTITPTGLMAIRAMARQTKQDISKMLLDRRLYEGLYRLLSELELVTYGDHHVVSRINGLMSYVAGWRNPRYERDFARNSDLAELVKFFGVLGGNNPLDRIADHISNMVFESTYLIEGGTWGHRIKHPGVSIKRLEAMVDLLGALIEDVGRLPDIGLPPRLDDLVEAHRVLGSLYRDLVRSPMRVRILGWSGGLRRVSRLVLSRVTMLLHETLVPHSLLCSRHAHATGAVIRIWDNLGYEPSGLLIYVPD